MAYCRWSSDDWQCDVYVYEDVAGGYTIHVATNRPIFRDSLPEPVEWDPDNVEPWFTRHFAVMKIMERAERAPIGGPYDGETFRDPTPDACADRLEMLRAAGYNVPQYAINELRNEVRATHPTERSESDGNE